jgi:hypothetical protein
LHEGFSRIQEWIKRMLDDLEQEFRALETKLHDLREYL